MHTRQLPPRLWRVLAPLLFAIFIQCGAVDACELDGVASMTVNGLYAATTTTAPTSRTIATWAPFFLGIATQGEEIRIGEDLAKLARSLPKSALVAPFRWQISDGTTLQSMVVVHHFVQPHWYRIDVQYYWLPSHRWIAFDSANILVVPLRQPQRAAFIAAQTNITASQAPTDSHKATSSTARTVPGSPMFIAFGALSLLLLAAIAARSKKHHNADR